MDQVDCFVGKDCGEFEIVGGFCCGIGFGDFVGVLYQFDFVIVLVLEMVVEQCVGCEWCWLYQFL